MLKVVVLNGGRGAASIIHTLLNRQGLHVTSVVNAYDDGKSTGEIRRFFKMLGPSDIRKVQQLMLPLDDLDYKANLELFEYRFPHNCSRNEVLMHLKAFVDGESKDLGGSIINNTNVTKALKLFINEFVIGLGAIEQVKDEHFSFADCSIMNCIYAGAFLIFNRNIEETTIFIERLFKLRGTVLPTSIEDKKLVALRENGQVLYSESEIVELRSNVRVESIYLLDENLDRSRFDSLDIDSKRYYLQRHHCYVSVSLGVRSVLQQADIIIYSSGTQHSSLYPTYMSAGLSECIADNHAAYKVFVTNIGADYETPSYRASDYIRGAFNYLSRSDKRDYNMLELFDLNLVNQSRYKSDETYVQYDASSLDEIPVPMIVDSFESQTSPGKHDGAKVVQTILDRYEATCNLI